MNELADAVASPLSLLSLLCGGVRVVREQGNARYEFLFYKQPFMSLPADLSVAARILCRAGSLAAGGELTTGQHPGALGLCVVPRLHVSVQFSAAGEAHERPRELVIGDTVRQGAASVHFLHLPLPLVGG